jgi:hypothetical protein
VRGKAVLCDVVHLVRAELHLHWELPLACTWYIRGSKHMDVIVCSMQVKRLGLARTKYLCTVHIRYFWQGHLQVGSASARLMYLLITLIKCTHLYQLHVQI